MAKRSLTQGFSTAADISIGVLLLIIATLLSVSGAFGQGIPVGLRFGFTITGAVLYVVGGHLYRRGKKASVVLAHELLKSDPRPPVVYLRAFREDAIGAAVPESPVSTVFSLMATEEQQIAEVFGELGPFVAIGRPGERLPELGAARMYVADDEWQQTISDLMSIARLVVFRATDTQGFIWEVKRAGECLPPVKMVFLIPSASNYESFRQIVEPLLPGSLPEFPKPKLRCGSLAGLVYFDSEWRSHFVVPRVTWFRNKIRKPLTSTLKMLVKPVFQQLDCVWSPPTINWFVYFCYFGITLVLPITLMLFAFALTGDASGLLAILFLCGSLQGFTLLLLGITYLLLPKPQPETTSTTTT